VAGGGALDTAQSALSSLLPADFDPKLRTLVTRLLASHVPEWRDTVLASGTISPPKLVDFDWRVDMKTSSNFLSRMAAPTAFVEMKVQNPVTVRGCMPGTRSVQFELSPQALRTMLDGLGKIRDQLSSIG